MSWPANPTNGQKTYINGITYEWNATDSVWNRMYASINIPDYTTAETVSFPAQPNITSTGTLSSLTVTGDSVITGNLTVTGTTEYFNTISMKIQDPLIELGGGANGAPLTTNDNRDRGLVLHYYSSVASKAVDAFMGWDNSTSEFRFASNVSVSGEVATFNTYGNVRGNYFFGNGSQLTGVIGNSNYAGYAGNVTEAVQPNITSLGTLIDTTMGASNSLSGGNLLSASYLTGTLTTAAQPNITSTGTLTSLTVTGLVTATAGGIKVGNIQDPTGTNTISVNSGTVGIIGNLTVGTGGVGNISATNATINSGLAVTGGSTFALSSDRTTYVGSASSGAVNLDVAAAGPVWYFTSVSSSFVANFQNVPTTDGFTTVVSLAFVSSTVVPTVQIAGASQTIKWLYGAEPLGDAASTNFYTFTLMRVNSSWVVFGHQSLYA